MKYIDSLGIKKNLDRLFAELIKQRNNAIKTESEIRNDTQASVIALEQQATDAYLNNIEVQQQITELELMLIGGVNYEL